jgi:hypothetical protein
MHCLGCEARSPQDEAPRAPAHPVPLWGADRISGLRCVRCGALLCAEDIARLLLAKQSQLEQFGLLRPPTDPESSPPPRALRVVRLEKE